MRCAHPDVCTDDAIRGGRCRARDRGRLLDRWPGGSYRSSYTVWLEQHPDVPWLRDDETRASTADARPAAPIGRRGPRADREGRMGTEHDPAEATPLPTIHRRNLGADVYRILWERILSRGLDPGEKLSDPRLSEQLGVSRTPVREALHRLVQDGVARGAEPGVLRRVILAGRDRGDLRHPGPPRRTGPHRPAGARRPDRRAQPGQRPDRRR